MNDGHLEELGVTGESMTLVREWPRVPNRTDAREASARTRAPQVAAHVVD